MIPTASGNDLPRILTDSYWWWDCSVSAVETGIEKLTVSFRWTWNGLKMCKNQRQDLFPVISLSNRMQFDSQQISFATVTRYIRFKRVSLEWESRPYRNLKARNPNNWNLSATAWENLGKCFNIFLISQTVTPDRLCKIYAGLCEADIPLCPLMALVQYYRRVTSTNTDVTSYCDLIRTQIALNSILTFFLVCCKHTVL